MHRTARETLLKKRHPEFPICMRIASLDERSSFYANEFKLDPVAQWVRNHPLVIFAVILGRYSHVFPREYARIFSNTVVIDGYRDLVDLRDYILQYRPESVYYDRNLYKDRDACSRCGRDYSDCWGCEGFLGQELAIDMDVENVYCPIHGDLDERMNRRDHISFCEYDLFTLRDFAVELLDELNSEFKEIKMTYSGRGYHLHILDKSAYRMSRRERKEFAKQIGKKYPIDEWVTEGESHLIRLPFSLNGLVSRIVIPLDKKELERFDPVTDKRCIPIFLSKHR